MFPKRLDTHINVELWNCYKSWQHDWHKHSNRFIIFKEWNLWSQCLQLGISYSTALDQRPQFPAKEVQPWAQPWKSTVPFIIYNI
jgi:hypothetical protein